MRVVCIKEPTKESIAPGIKSRVRVGEFYEVIDQIEAYGDVYYELSVHPNGYYRQDYFVPCSDIDETELVNKKEEVLHG